MKSSVRVSTFSLTGIRPSYRPKLFGRAAPCTQRVQFRENIGKQGKGHRVTLCPGATKPHEAAAEVRVNEVAKRAGGVVTIEVPRAAPKHTVFFFLQPQAVGPFPDVARHLLRAIGRSPRFSVLTHLRSALDPALGRVTPLLRELLAPRIAPAIDAPRGLLPLLFRGEPFAGPFGIGCRAVPTHKDYRMIPIPSLHREPALAPGNSALFLLVSALKIDPLRAPFFPVSALVQEPAELAVGDRKAIDPESLADGGHAQVRLLLPAENKRPRGDINHAICKALLIAVLRRYQVMHEPDDGLIQLACRDLAPQQCLRHLLRHEEFHERLMRELVIPFRIPVQKIADPDLLVEAEAVGRRPQQLLKEVPDVLFERAVVNARQSVLV